MKNIRNSSIAALTFMLVFWAGSCQDFLEVPPAAQLDDTRLTTSSGLQGLLIGAYAQLNGRANRMSGPTNWLWGSIRGGDCNKGTDPGDFADINPIQRYEYLSTQQVIADVWGGLYEGVARCNNVLRQVQLAGEDVSEEERTELMAQARFLRGHYYFGLKRNFNNTPYVDETMDYGGEMDIATVGNSEDLWPKIEADFQYAYDNLPNTQESVGRANKWAAAAFLGKVFLYQKKFAEALEKFNEVIDEGTTSGGDKYKLLPNFADVFRATNDNNSEVIFAFQAAANTGNVTNANPEWDLNWPYNTGSDGPGNCCGFFQPSFETVNSFRTNADGLPLLDKAYNTAENAVKSDMGIPSKGNFTLDAGRLDPRLDHTVGRRGIPFLDWSVHPGAAWIRNQANGGPYTPKKYSYYRSDIGSLQDNSSWTPGYTALNFPIIRFADILLMAAECEVEAGPARLNAARDLVNIVRERASDPETFVMNKDGKPAAKYVIGLYDTPWKNQETARTAVRFERKLELNEEGHRFYDLVRWGIADEELNDYLQYEGRRLIGALGGSRFTPNKNEYLPLPQAQIDLVGTEVLVQNPGY